MTPHLPHSLAIMATKLTIAGFKTCSYYVRARTALQGLQVLQSPNMTLEVVEHEDRDSYKAWWATFKPRFGVRADTHASSPAVWLGDSDFLGGHDDTLAWIRSNYMAGAAVSKPPRVVHANDPKGPEDGAGYDYDLVVIGGGSGGLAASQEAIRVHPGLRVAVLDFVKPSWVGTSWGLGGTCVNVGCIPKKLMHNAALLGDSLTDASAFGWALPPKGEIKHSWEKLVQGVQDHIASINFSYRVALREVGVKYENALGAFKDPHTLVLTDKKGKTKEVTARRVMIAVGGRPTRLDIPGGELALSSDDLFSLATPPGKTLVVGASYVALECAGFLAGMGYDTTVMVRSILLRGFDTQCADMIGDHMEAHGAKFQRSRVPTRIERTEDGRLRVFSKNVSEGGAGGEGEFSDVYDTVFTAVGRYADTAKLNLEAAGVVAGKDGKLVTVGEQTNVPHIYAIGDVVKGAPELTPVAIAAGKYLARRLYGKSTEGMDYDRIATTVFTPLEYGTVGLSEEAAKEKLGEDNVEVFHSFFTPLEYSIVEERPKNKCYAKLVINKKDQNRVVGFHVLGPNSGEITQGWACAVRLGATYESFLQTVGIHPTSAEEFTQLTVTKSSGESADKGNC